MSDLPDNNRDEARRWLDQAREDLAAAKVLAEHEELPARGACFHAHLAAEKALKAGLIAAGVPFKKVHDLAEIRGLLPPGRADAVDVADLELLNPWVIDGRYPGDVPEATSADAAACIAAAARVVDVIQRLLGEPGE